MLVCIWARLALDWVGYRPGWLFPSFSLGCFFFWVGFLPCWLFDWFAFCQVGLGPDWLCASGWISFRPGWVWAWLGLGWIDIFAELAFAKSQW